MYEPNPRQGRVFCVIVMKNLHPQTPTTESQTTTNQCHLQSSKTHGSSPSDSDSSGYLSTSSFESTGEERRLVLNEGKVFKVWEQWAQHLGSEFQKVSTPKRESDEEITRDSLPVGRVNEAGKCTLTLKKTLGDSKRKHAAAGRSDRDCGEKVQSVKANCMFRTCSETDVSRRGTLTAANEHQRDNSRRKPFQSFSTNRCFAQSERDLRASGVSAVSRENSESTASLPIRKSENGTDNTRNSIITQKLSKYCTDGRPVDESMVDFLEKADKENLASLLNFYDKMTTDSEGRTTDIARRKRSNYEAVYY